MKVKYYPEDFVVVEKTKVSFVPSGAYCIYELTKRNIDALAMKRILERLFKTKEMGMAGLKDRNALTTQLISVPGKPLFKNHQEKNFSLVFKGYSKSSIRKGDLIENKFHITLRNVSKKQKELFENNISFITKHGFVNYFGDQRFGHITKAKKFILEPYLNGDAEKSVKLYLTLYRKKDSSETKKRKRFFLENWGNWKKCSEVKDSVSRKMFLALQQGKSFEFVLKMIPKELLELYILSYVSYLWNKKASQYIEQFNHVLVKTEIGVLAFPKEVIPEKMISAEIPQKSYALTNKITFPKRKLFVKTNIVRHLKENKIILDFSLPSGAYATTLLKALFEQ